MVIYVVKAAFVSFSATGGNPVNAGVASQQLFRASHSVRIYQPLEVASEVVVHRITQVGRFRHEYDLPE